MAADLSMAEMTSRDHTTLSRTYYGPGVKAGQVRHPVRRIMSLGESAKMAKDYYARAWSVFM